MNTFVTVSLTTTPIRINNIVPTLISLLSQSRAPDEILLYLPKYCERFDTQITDIPLEIIDIEKNTQLEVIFTDDYGPATKFLPAWRRIIERGQLENDHFLIWLDDDVIYNEFLVEEYITHCPEKAAIGGSGFALSKKHGHFVQKNHLAEANIIEGYAGICCRVADMPDLNNIWHKKSYKDMSTQEKYFWHSDDYVISRALQDNNIKTVVCYTEKYNRYLNKLQDYGLQEDSLQYSEVTSGHKHAYAMLERERTFKVLYQSLKAQQ